MVQFVQTGVAFGVALIPYVQLPVSAYFAHAPSTWGDQRTVAGDKVILSSVLLHNACAY